MVRKNLQPLAALCQLELGVPIVGSLLSAAISKAGLAIEHKN